MWKSLPGDTGFEGTKGSWRAAKAQYWEGPVEANEEAAALAVVEPPGLKGLWRNVNTWCHIAR